jgi:hypothetical protein
MVPLASVTADGAVAEPRVEGGPGGEPPEPHTTVS